MRYKVFHQSPASPLGKFRGPGGVHRFEHAGQIMLDEGSAGLVSRTLQGFQQVPHDLICLCRVPAHNTGLI